jgi:hypothetical protein
MRPVVIHLVQSQVLPVDSPALSIESLPLEQLEPPFLFAPLRSLPAGFSSA